MRALSPSKKTQLPWSLNLFAMLLLFLAALCFFVVLYCCSTPTYNKDPYNLPWFGENFPDLTFLQPRFLHFHSREFFTSPGVPYLYPSPNGVIYKVFFLVAGRHPVDLFLLTTTLIYAVAGTLFWRALLSRGTSALQAAAFVVFTLLCSYPIWFELKQANIEIVTWVLISTGLALFLSGRSYLAAVFFCLAGSMKIYPVIFLGLLLEKRQYRQIAVGVSVLVSVTVLSTWLLCPDFGFSWRNVNMGVDHFREQYMLRNRYETVMDHSLFATIKTFWRPLPNAARISQVLNVYLGVVAIVGIVLWFTRIRRQPVFNQILALTIASILFPPTSFEYTLQHVLAPLALFVLLFVDFDRLDRKLPFAKTYLTCFLLLLAPIPEFIHDKARVDGRLKSLVLVAMFLLSLKSSVAVPTNQETEKELSWWELAKDASTNESTPGSNPVLIPQ